MLNPKASLLDSKANLLDPQQCRQARLARDQRFDGRFYVGVSTTGIYCRPTCPATPSREDHVRYFESPYMAARAGFRPCLRCRPDSAPGSPAWQGSRTTLKRALALIDQGALQRGDVHKGNVSEGNVQKGTVCELCDRLGIGERYLRQLFQQRFGLSPKAYALYRQCLFAKQLLHQTSLPVTDIAYASGFASLRRFNDAFKRQLSLTPREIRQSRRASGDRQAPLTLMLDYRPPYQWERLRHFYALHIIDGLEWVDDNAFGRTFRWGEITGHFTAVHDPEQHRFHVTLVLSDLGKLDAIVRRIRQMLDLDADTRTLEAHLEQALPQLPIAAGLRLPGLWDVFEAGIRGVLGQQISIVAATRLIQQLVDHLGESDGDGRRYFPTAKAIAASDLMFLKLPGARRATLIRFAQAYADGDIGATPAEWTRLKGIGPWTANVAAFRGLSDPDVWLTGDVGVNRALTALQSNLKNPDFDPARASPWRSYLTLQLWNRVI